MTQPPGYQPVNHLLGGTERGRALALVLVVYARPYLRRALRRAADIPHSDRERAGAFETVLFTDFAVHNERAGVSGLIFGTSDLLLSAKRFERSSTLLSRSPTQIA